MSQVINVSDSLTVIPSGYNSSHSSYSSINSNYPITNSYTDSSSTSYTYITCNTGSSASTYISYTFDFSAIPANATIDSITAKAKVRVSSTSYISTGYLRLYNGTTAMGSNTSARTTTATAYTIASPGTWTRSTLDNLELRYTGTRGTSNTTRAAYLYFYGADITVNYSINGTQYTLTAVSEVNDVSISPLAADVMEGNSQIFTINFENDITIDDIKITDNDNDVTSSLQKHQGGDSGTISAVPSSNFDTGFSSSDTNFYQSSSTTSTSWLEYAIGHSAESPYSTSNTSNTYVKPESSTGWINYKFDFSEIPANATITNVSVKVYGARENATVDTTHVARFQCYSGSTAKGTIQNFTSTSNSSVTISDVGTWTVSELYDAQLRFEIGYYGGRMLGITWSVSYTTPASDYYTYTLTNVSADHTIVIEQAGAFVPPEEDPEKVYYPITISSINATTSPSSGTTRVEAGTSETITITPSDPQLTLALDNGTDITDQLVGGIPNNQYSIATAPGASYGFNLNSSTGYYVSTNAGVSSSAAVARVALTLESDCLVTFTYINYGEATYDYGLFGKLDTTVATDGLTAGSNGSSPSDSTSNYQLICNTSAYNTSSAQTLTYQVSAGTHYIDVKYGKDAATDSNNDTLQFKVTLEATSAGGQYTYTLSNINQKHSLIFVFGDVNYYFVTSTGNNCKLYPDGQTVKLEGDAYHVTIIPNSNNATVTLTDNNIDKTSLLEYYEGEDKQGNTIVNYVYRLNNITATHNLNISCIAADGPTIYLKINGNWVACSKVYQKINGNWVEQQDYITLFSNDRNYLLQ